MSKQIPISPQALIEDFLNTVEIKGEYALMCSTEKEQLYLNWSEALNYIAATYPQYTERAQHLAQYLDTLFHGNPFTE